MGKYDEAIAQMNEALKYDTSDPILYDHRGDILASLNNIEEARKSWEKALELNPGNEAILSKLNRK